MDFSFIFSRLWANQEVDLKRLCMEMGTPRSSFQSDSGTAVKPSHM